MKIHLKRFVAIVSFGCISIISWNAFTSYANKRVNERKSLTPIETKLKANSENNDLNKLNSGNALNSQKKFQSIECMINDEYAVHCIKALSEDLVYIPFTFIKKYFEINGKLIKKTKGKEVFEWQHSYSKVYYPREIRLEQYFLMV